MEQALGKESERQEKHVLLNSAINNLERIRDKAQTLLHRIVDGPAPPNEIKEPDTIDPTLADMLESAPDRINKECEFIDGAISNIENVLF